MSRSILDDNYDYAKTLQSWLDAAMQATNEWRASGRDGSVRRLEAWERVERIARHIAEHAKHSAEAEDAEPVE